jgi:hypothetical protein
MERLDTYIIGITLQTGQYVRKHFLAHSQYHAVELAYSKYHQFQRNRFYYECIRKPYTKSGALN